MRRRARYEKRLGKGDCMATRRDGPLHRLRRSKVALVPGLAFTAAVGIVALGLAAMERRVLAHELLEPLVLALLLGMLLRTCAAVPTRAEPEIAYAAKQVLEGAIVLL